MNRLTGTAIGGGLVLVLLLGGCGGGSDASEGPADPASSSSDTAGRSAGSDAPADESPSSTPTVEPATGPLLKQEHATMNAPTGYNRQPDMVPFETSAGSKQLGSIDVVTLGQMPWGHDENMDEAVRLTIKTWGDGPPPERLKDVEIGGLPAFHVAGPSGKYHVLEEYGVLYEGDLVYFTFDLDNINSAAKRRAAIESSLATVRWR